MRMTSERCDIFNIFGTLNCVEAHLWELVACTVLLFVARAIWARSHFIDWRDTEGFVLIEEGLPCKPWKKWSASRISSNKGGNICLEFRLASYLNHHPPPIRPPNRNCTLLKLLGYNKLKLGETAKTALNQCWVIYTQCIELRIWQSILGQDFYPTRDKNQP